MPAVCFMSRTVSNAVPVVDISHRSSFSLQGAEALDLLQRISTNDLRSLEPGMVGTTVLTSEKGKIVDVITILMEEPDHVRVLCQSSVPNTTRSWIEKFIIMEDVRVLPPGEEERRYLVFGGEASRDRFAAVAERHFKRGYDGTSEETGLLIAAERWNGQRLLQVIVSPGTGGSFAGLTLAPETEWHAFRIRHGIPAVPQELNPDWNPLEAGIAELVSFTKGCYVGQEVIARIDTYKKVQHRLVRVRLDRRPGSTPASLQNEAGSCGMLTSVTDMPVDGRYEGLAYVRRSIDARAQGLIVRDAAGPISVRLNESAIT